MKRNLYLFMVVLVAIGCSPKQENGAGATSSSGGGPSFSGATTGGVASPLAKTDQTNSTPGSKPDSGTESKPADQPTSTSQPSGAPKPTVDTLPASLKNAAFDYYGLGETKPQKFQVSTGTGAPSIATRSVILADVKDGKATFQVHQEGGPLGVYDQTLSLEPDGIYTLGSSPMTLKTPHVIELPTNLSVGGGWKDHAEIESQGKSIVIDNSWKVVRTEKVKTAAGNFDGLYIRGTGSGKSGSDPVKMTTETWFVKGVGAVKQSVSMVVGSKKNSMTIELAK